MKGPICVSYTMFHDQVERIHNQKNETVAYHQGGEEVRGWLSAKVLIVTLLESERLEKCSRSWFVIVGNNKCAKRVKVITNTMYNETG